MTNEFKQQRMSIGKQLAATTAELDKVKLANDQLVREIEYYRRNAALSLALLTNVTDTLQRTKALLEAQLMDQP